MKKILFVIGAFFVFLACTKGHKDEDSVDIIVRSWNQKLNDRNGEDYVKLWVNDTLLFSDTFHVSYVDSIHNGWYDMIMKVATIPKTNQDSIKIRVRLVSLDSVLFAGQHAVDTTFRYRIDNIPYVSIAYWRVANYFRVKDPVTDPQAFYFD